MVNGVPWRIGISLTSTLLPFRTLRLLAPDPVRSTSATPSAPVGTPLPRWVTAS